MLFDDNEIRQFGNAMHIGGEHGVKLDIGDVAKSTNKRVAEFYGHKALISTPVTKA